MSITTEVLVPYTEYGVPSGTYDGSSLGFIGEAKPAANYYRGRGSLQTVTYNFNGFAGNVFVEATLDADPASAIWVKVSEFITDTAPTTGIYPSNVLGNFTWLRARVENFSENIINSITVTY
jgi:hypothetical protein